MVAMVFSDVCLLNITAKFKAGFLQIVDFNTQNATICDGSLESSVYLLFNDV